ncbi:MAG: flagellar hook-associated protein 3 [Arcobacter sp.]|nr:flagellar hook-associated protein 3 [Arcobacter sp.]
MILTANEMNYRLDNLNVEQRRISYQLSTGRKIDEGSEDSDIYGRELYVENKLSVYREIGVQIDKTVAQNTASDAAIVSIKKLVDKIKSELIKANTSTASDSDRKIIGKQLEGVKHNLFDLVNTRIEGDFVFSGQKTRTQSFVQDSTGKVTYEGDFRSRKVLVEEGSYRKKGVTGIDLMMYPTSIATKVSPILTFTDEHRIVDQNDEEWKLNATKDKIVRFDYRGLETTDTRNVTSDGNNPPTYTVDVTDPTATNDGIRFEAKRNFFDILDEGINALNKVDKNGNPISSQQSRDIIGSTQNEVLSAFDNMNAAHSKLGSRNKVFEVAKESVTSQLFQFKVLSEEIIGVDLGKVAMEAKALQMTYTGLYSTINKTNQLSLVNYIK